MIDEKLLDEAILEVAKKRMGQELRNAIIYGSPEMGEVYNLYLDKVKAEMAKEVKTYNAVPRALLALLVCLVLYGLVLYALMVKP